MLEEFKSLYYLHPWLRYIAWCGLFLSFAFLLGSAGGFPPPALLRFLQALADLPGAWHSEGAVCLLPLFFPGSLLILGGVAWVASIWVSRELVHCHYHLLRLREQPVDSDWQVVHGQPSHLALAVSTSGGQSMVNNTTLTLAMPRLRLPQKEPRVQPAYKPATWARRTVELSPDQRERVQDIQNVPTHPAPTSSDNVAQRLVLQPLMTGVGWHSGIARSRNPNEDSLVVLQGTCTYHGQLVPFGLFVVADGMGGHDCGLEASRLAMQSMMYTVLQNVVIGKELTDEFLLDMLTAGVQWANLSVYQHAREWQKDMGTTLTAALVVGARAYVVNVGDSRTYLYRPHASLRLKQITRDHSLVARLVETGEIAPDDIYSHPQRNKVYRCLGSDEQIKVDGFIEDLQPKDKLLLCSDGLWEMVRNPDIERLLCYDVEPMRSCDMLTRAALSGGGCDNISVVVAYVP